MWKKLCKVLLCMLMFVGISACTTKKEPNEKVKIGVSMGVGPAARWELEKTYMEDEAKKIGADIEVRLNKTDKPLTQEEDCKELIDSGIDVLILTPRDVNDVEGILDYAKEKDVKVISYARAILNQTVDLYVGYDSTTLGEMMGQFLTELAYEGNYILLRGDANDFNAKLLYDGSMKAIEKMKGSINIIGDIEVTGWDPALAKEKVIETLSNNDLKVSAILAPNDKLAGASVEALQELGITTPVIITGMDAELDAIKRIVAGTQTSTIYMDLRELANTAINEACHMAKGEKVNVNSKFDNGVKDGVDANLIVGQTITKQNIDKQLIDKKVFTKEEVYGTQ